jgi:vacuolar-type H+-ATPase subunit D/Vma8
MEQANLTRMALLAKRAQISLAVQGRDLLREKCAALCQEFFQTASAVVPESGGLEEPARVLDHVQAMITGGSGGLPPARPDGTDAGSRGKLIACAARLQRLEKEIRRTTRRLNALENSVIPRLQGECLCIETALQEQECQELLRLRHLKQAVEEENDQGEGIAAKPSA